jgi:hypothetical protein
LALQAAAENEDNLALYEERKMDVFFDETKEYASK